MAQTLHFTAEEAGERIDAFLGRIAPQYTRSQWQKLCQQECVLVAGQPVKPNHKLHVDDAITVYLPAQPDFAQRDLPILFEDDDVLVINKPTGVLTHAKGVISDEFSVAEFVRPRTTDGLETNRPGIVHRLDRDTSGVMIAAKNPEAKHWLQKQFSQRKVKKTYIALTEGHLTEPQAIIRLPIERNPKKPQTFRVGANGKTAETFYHVEQMFRDTSLVRLEPLTGRTHQLRVHLQHLGHPIVGDKIYGSPSKQLTRMFLHAATLEVTLPSKEHKIFTAPLPPELQTFLSQQPAAE